MSGGAEEIRGGKRSMMDSGNGGGHKRGRRGVGEGAATPAPGEYWISSDFNLY